MVKGLNKSKNKLVYLAFNKPKGIVCTTDSKVEKDNIIDFINYPKRIFPSRSTRQAERGIDFLNK